MSDIPKRGQYRMRLEPKTLLLTTDGTIITRKGRSVKHHFTEVNVEVVSVNVETEELKTDVISLDDLVDGYLHYLDLRSGRVKLEDIQEH